MNLVDRLFNGNSSGGGIVPSGTIYITENGEGIDVSSYATADVNVSGGGGGDITTANITFEVSGVGNAQTYFCQFVHDDDIYTGFIINDETGVSVDTFGFSVYYGEPTTTEVYILTEQYILVGTQMSDEVFTITGNAEAFTDTSMGEPYNMVKVYGDCTISVVGNR